MPVLPHRKNKVSLADFNYLREIETRLFFARLSVKEIAILREIVDDSLKIDLPEFAKRTKTPLKTLQLFLKKLEGVKFLKIDGNFLIIDKEQRKISESFLIKFDEDFEPGMEYLKGLLSKIPPITQTQWYHLPRNADNIFQTLIDNIFLTPKIYKQYVEQLEYDHPLLKTLVKDLYASPDLSLTAAKVIQKHKLTEEQFHELVLLMEYNLVGCLSYQPNQKGSTDEGWDEVITPFAEWRTFQHFLKKTAPKPVTGKVKRFHVEDFAFVLDLSQLLEKIIKTPAAPKSTDPYTQEMLDRLLFIHLVKEENGKLIAKESAHKWLKKSIEDRALSMSRHPTAVEKGLHRVLQIGWVYVDDFLEGFFGVLGSKEKLSLKNRGKKWGYFLPEYTDEEKVVIRQTLTERLFEAGFVALGEHQGKQCFCVTNFGRKFLEE